ncbi:hypothetical protein EVAR_33137_1 [Eumeta japonica]|uniref:Uncharacterized protein n=1 Tax=Eumeta variegata TaxID=151549 RepID=A0A4C1Y9V5_EUMVA|nr:hypothetical protein EVAR_33137_1 [Eumeta japonica]
MPEVRPSNVEAEERPFIGFRTDTQNVLVPPRAFQNSPRTDRTRVGDAGRSPRTKAGARKFASVWRAVEINWIHSFCLRGPARNWFRNALDAPLITGLTAGVSVNRALALSDSRAAP